MPSGTGTGTGTGTELRMLMGQVIGTVVSTRKEQELEGIKLLLVRGVDLDGKLTSAVIVAADAVGAGVGELVLYAAGSLSMMSNDSPGSIIEPKRSLLITCA